MPAGQGTLDDLSSPSGRKTQRWKFPDSHFRVNNSLTCPEQQRSGAQQGLTRRSEGYSSVNSGSFVE